MCFGGPSIQLDLLPTETLSLYSNDTLLHSLLLSYYNDGNRALSLDVNTFLGSSLENSLTQVMQNIRSYVAVF